METIQNESPVIKTHWGFLRSGFSSEKWDEWKLLYSIENIKENENKMGVGVSDRSNTLGSRSQF